MIPLIIIGFLVAFLAVIVLIVQLATRVVTGSMPTLGSTIGTIIVAALISAGAGWMFTRLNMNQTLSGIVICGCISLLLQALGYSVTLQLKSGDGVSLTQAILVLLVEIPLSFVLVLVLVLGGAALGFGLESWQKLPGWAALHSKVTPPGFVALAPPPQTPSGPVRLAVVVKVPTSYGMVTVPAGTAVQILRPEGDGYRARVAGTEVILTSDQLSGAPR